MSDYLTHVIYSLQYLMVVANCEVKRYVIFSTILLRPNILFGSLLSHIFGLYFSLSVIK